MINNVVFILGVPRSGNTLLSAILNNSNNIYFPEFSFSRRLIRIVNNQKLNLNQNNSLKLFKSIENDKNLKKLFANILYDLDPKTISPKILIQSLFLKFIEQNQIVYLGDKSPNMVYYFEFLNTFFPSSKIIFMVRDPRDNINSLIRRQYFSLKESIWTYSVYNDIILRYYHILGDERSMLVKFEDLISNSKITLKKVCNFLEIDYNNNMLSLNHYENVQNSYVSSKLDASKIGSWKKVFTQNQILKIESHCKIFLENYDYKFENSNIEATSISKRKLVFSIFINEFKMLFQSKRKEMRDGKLKLLKIPLTIRIKRITYKLIKFTFIDFFKANI